MAASPATANRDVAVIPITIDGVVVGGIGVSGAHSQAEDEEIAIAGASVLASQGGSK